MFSFLKFLNLKSDADKSPNSLSGKTLNLNSSEARVLNIFNNKSPIARKPNNSNSPARTNNRETVTSPGFSFRIAQRAREMRSTTPNTDVLNASSSYALENTLNDCNIMNVSTAPRDIYDKKRKLMETLDNFGVRKRTRQEYQRNHRSTQPVVMNSVNINIENKKVKRNGDFGTDTSHLLKKPRTRNNEILSSYSSSKFLLKPGQKRPRSFDHDDDSPSRKHCRSCTCCGSTILLENDQHNLNKSDKTTETDVSDDLVTVAAGRIFNRSGKTQVVKKICIKTILDEVFEDNDHLPYTSFDKLEEKKRRKDQEKVLSAEKNIKKSDVKDNNLSVNLNASPTVISKFNNKIQPPVTSVLSTDSSSSNSLTPSLLVETTSPLVFNSCPSDSTPKLNEGNKNNAPLQFKLESPLASASSNEETQKQTELDGKTPESAYKNNMPIFETPKTITVNIKLNKPLSLSPEINQNVVNDKSQIIGQNDSTSDKDKPVFQLAETVSKPSECVVNSPTVSDLSKLNANNLPVIKFGSQVENSLKQSTPVMQFGAPKSDNKSSPPAIQFGVPKVDDKQSTPVLQFGVSKVDDKQQPTPVMQFGTPRIDNKPLPPIIQFGATKVDDKQSTPVMQFGVSNVDDKQSTPVMKFGAPREGSKQSTPVMQFGAPKVDNKQTTPAPLFAFGNNQKSSENTKSSEPVKFQFGSSKPDTESVESKNVAFGSNNLQNSQNLFSFGKTDNNVTLSASNPPKYDAATDKSTPKLQFGATVFGTSNLDQSSKPQFGASSGQSSENQGPKLVFGSQITENKPTASTSPVFQFNSSSAKPNEKAPATFPFSSTTTAPTFGDKAPFQFNAPKPEVPKTQFPTSTFGSQSSSAAPFKFGANDKPSFGNSFSPSNQPIQFSNNTEKTAEPFKFGSTAPQSNNAFQFGNNKTDNGPVKFGQTSNTFSVPGFTGFGNSAAPQQNTTFGSVPPSQPSPFGNMTSPSAAPTFGSVASPTPNAFGSAASPTANAFGTNPSFQFTSTNNAPSSSATFAFGSNSQPAKPVTTFNFNAAPTAATPFQFGQTQSAMPPPQFGGTQSPQGKTGAFGFGSSPVAATVMPGSSQPLFSMGTAPAGERRKAKAVRRRQ